MIFLYHYTTKKNIRLLRSLSDASVKRQLLQLVLALVLLLLAHTLAMRYFEGLDWEDAVWLTMTTVTTVGYGDYSAITTLGRLASIILLYGAGIAILAQVVGLYFEFRQGRRARILNGDWSWDMEDHLVFINSPKEGAERYFQQLMSQLRRSALPVGQKPALIVTTHFTHGIAQSLRALDVAHINQSVIEQTAMERSSLSRAAIIAVLCPDANDPLSDSINFDIVTRVREINPTALVIAEAVADENRERLIKAGANNVVRPIRSYPELLVRTILAPGTEQVIEELFNSDGEECVRYEVALKGRWGDIAAKLIQKDIGIPLAFIDSAGQVVSNAPPDSEIEATTLYVVVRKGNLKSTHAVMTQLHD